jgi:probable F420-dependent oxidoreductase
MSGTKPTFGIQTYNYAPDDLFALARAAERLGFEGIWLGEHYANPISYASRHPGEHGSAEVKEDDILGPHVTLYDPWFTLGAIAGATARLKIGTAITIVPLMDPLLLARATATAHHVSGGRFRLGTGAGWLKEEFDILGIPFAERGGRLDEAIAIMRKAWAGGYFVHEGRHFRYPEQQITEKPTPVPLVCGGNSGPALQRVVRVADAWMNSAMVTIESALELRALIETERRKAGHLRDLDYFIRPEEPERSTIQPFFDEGFENIVLWGPHVWPIGGELTASQKEERLGEIAVKLNVSAP